MSESHIDLDLDELQPKASIVKIAGQEVEVHPAKFNDLINLMSAFSKLQNSQDGIDATTVLSELNITLNNIAPQLKEKGIELTMDQFTRLVTFIFSMSSPTEQKELEKAGVTLDPEKKSPEEQSSPS